MDDDLKWIVKAAIAGAVNVIAWHLLSLVMTPWAAAAIAAPLLVLVFRWTPPSVPMRVSPAKSVMLAAAAGVFAATGVWLIHAVL